MESMPIRGSTEMDNHSRIMYYIYYDIVQTVQSKLFLTKPTRPIQPGHPSVGTCSRNE